MAIFFKFVVFVINNIRNDNRIENLREVTHTQNQWNHAKRKNNTSGFKGVDFDKQNNKWRAQIRQNSKKLHLGWFLTPEEAYQAYCKAAIASRKEFARLLAYGAPTPAEGEAPAEETAEPPSAEEPAPEEEETTA